MMESQKALDLINVIKYATDERKTRWVKHNRKGFEGDRFVTWIGSMKTDLVVTEEAIALHVVDLIKLFDPITLSTDSSEIAGEEVEVANFENIMTDLKDSVLGVNLFTPPSLTISDEIRRILLG